MDYLQFRLWSEVLKVEQTVGHSAISRLLVEPLASFFSILRLLLPPAESCLPQLAFSFYQSGDETWLLAFLKLFLELQF